MKIKGLTDEDFVNYKKPSMFIATSVCSFKCETECGKRCCQNGPLALAPSIETETESIIKRYLANDITSAVVFGGLEPLDKISDIVGFLRLFRESYGCTDDVVVYTGYTKEEAGSVMDDIGRKYGPLVVKYGRFVPDQEPHFDPVLGVSLASPNQFAERIEKDESHSESGSGLR